MKKILLAVLIWAMFVYPVSVLAGPKVNFGDDGYLILSFLGQMHYQFLENATDENDFFLRRGRIILIGQLTDGIKMFLETDNDRHGVNGSPASSTDIQDIFIDVRLGHSQHWVEAGLILLPFSFESDSSATSLLGLDYNAETIKLTNTFVWRDYGAELHGSLGDRVSYRVGFFDGYEGSDKNSGAGLRFTGHTAFAVAGTAPTGWFYTQDSLGDNSYLTLGAGFDTQNGATLDSNGKGVDSDAWVTDLQGDYSLGKTGLGDMDFILNAAYYNWDNSLFDGSTFFVESGIRVAKIMLTGKYSSQDPNSGDSISDGTIGLHYFLKDHNAKAGIEYRSGDSDNLFLVGIQLLL